MKKKPMTFQNRSTHRILIKLHKIETSVEKLCRDKNNPIRKQILSEIEQVREQLTQDEEISSYHQNAKNFFFNSYSMLKDQFENAKIREKRNDEMISELQTENEQLQVVNRELTICQEIFQELLYQKNDVVDELEKKLKQLKKEKMEMFKDFHKNYIEKITKKNMEVLEEFYEESLKNLKEEKPKIKRDKIIELHKKLNESKEELTKKISQTNLNISFDKKE